MASKAKKIAADHARLSGREPASSPDELEDYLELRDPKVQRILRQSAQNVRAGRTRPASMLLAEHTKANDARKTKPCVS
jgi:hypothetical protein